MEQLKGLVFGIDKFAIHDGPGIRTLVRMKGCPLRCLWCSTPQSQKRTPDILYCNDRCALCGRCVEACPGGVITLTEENGWKINRKLCNGHGKCVEACPNQALELVGNHTDSLMTVEELFKEIEKDSMFFRRSGGGVTVGGGEATMQHEFVAQFLKRCKKNYIHTSIETCGYVEWESLEKILEYVDLVQYDIKHMDVTVHKELTGVSNEIILENAKRTAALRPMIIRIPIVPGYNDSDDNISATARFAAELGENLISVELLPYHKFGTHVYSELDMVYKLTDVEPPSDDHMIWLKEIAESCGGKVREFPIIIR